jgi:hypothetical protein
LGTSLLEAEGVGGQTQKAYKLILEAFNKAQGPLGMTTIAAEVVNAKLVMATSVVLTFVACLRPAKSMGLLCEDLVLPTANVTGHLTLIICPQDRGSRTQTGSVDDSVLLDSEETSWLKDVLQVLADRAP